MCFADYIDRITFQKQIWLFNEMSSSIKTFKNNKLYHDSFKKKPKYNPPEVRFTKVLTKYSTEYNNYLFIQELCQQLCIDKKDLFVSVGVTSTSYIKENIEEKYLVNNRLESSSVDTFGNNIVRYELEQTNSKVVTPSDSKSFNFANILNLSFGVELPINNQQQSIIIEPYFKYSLVPVTQQNLDFSSAGVHLRYNFSFKIKN